MSSIFLSYRRDDSPDSVARIHQQLSGRLRNRAIFYDHASLELGADFPMELRDRVTAAGVVLVIIGPKWLEILNDRKSQPLDHVREEIRLALASHGEVIPVLVNRATMPTAEDLVDFPEIAALAGKNAQTVSPDPLFEAESEKLVAHLERTGPSAIVGSVLSGKYKIQRAIGEGGMGEVYLAEQTQPIRRLVAIKLVKAGMDSKEILGRFEAERQALAVMDHPNICKVFDAGAAPNGRPFFVMEYVKGVPITQYCDDRKLTPKERLELFVLVCQAVQHAHQKGIVHRDIKPGNVLVELVDGKPVPKVIDFGLAKALGQRLTEHSFVATEYGKWVGTLEYSSPEQAEGRFDISTSSDIYSLGVLLYELLAGSPPFTRADLMNAGEDEMRKMIVTGVPSKPSAKISSSKNLPVIAANRQLEPKKLAKTVRGELDWIVMKALEKEPGQRFGSAENLAEDLGRYLMDVPVLARPNLRYRLMKRIRRNRKLLATALFVPLVLMVCYVMLADAGYELVGSETVRTCIDRNESSIFRPVPSPQSLRSQASTQHGSIVAEMERWSTVRGGWVANPNPVIKELHGAPEPTGTTWTQGQSLTAIATGFEAGNPRCPRHLDFLNECEKLDASTKEPRHWPYKAISFPIDTDKLAALDPKPSKLRFYASVPPGKFELIAERRIDDLEEIIDANTNAVRKGFHYKARGDGLEEFALQYVYDNGDLVPLTTALVPNFRIAFDTGPRAASANMTVRFYPNEGWGCPEEGPAAHHTLWMLTAYAGLLPAAKPEAAETIRAKRCIASLVYIMEEKYMIFSDTGTFTGFFRTSARPERDEFRTPGKYATWLGLFTLLEMKLHRCEWVWREQKLDGYIAACCQRLVESFDPAAGGWINPNQKLNSRDTPQTIANYDLLLRAEAEGAFELSPAMIESLREFIRELVRPSNSFETSTVYEYVKVINTSGGPPSKFQFTARFFGQLWSLDLFTRWYNRQRPRSDDPSQFVELRRAIGRSLTVVEREVTTRMDSTWAFQAAETAICLATVRTLAD